ncbi:sigma factor-like helix-turn-helix DNA-binding protein [Actinomadura madurae]|uniref:sigma factor-like helix-turn-helix DNA-binding protein n=1 Tax=Actinomadura madurae TaxID=1993 RepID=UPI000A4B2B65|nr:sigma factor-like helix-turn-helix DNA-binding protein [Actinomadura madurae]
MAGVVHCKRRRSRPKHTGRNPELADPERQAQARAELDAYVAGHHLKELRKAIAKTQAEVAQILGVSQSRVSQIDNPDGNDGTTGGRWAPSDLGEWGGDRVVPTSDSGRSAIRPAPSHHI